MLFSLIVSTVASLVDANRAAYTESVALEPLFHKTKRHIFVVIWFQCTLDLGPE